MFAIRTDITFAFSGQLRSKLFSENTFCRDGILLQYLIKLLPKEWQILDLTKDIQSLTAFRRQSGDFMKQLKKTKRPVVLTVNGKAAAVVQDVGAYQRLLDIAASADEEEAIRQGLDDVAHGRTRPAREFFEEFRRKHGIPR